MENFRPAIVRIFAAILAATLLFVFVSLAGCATTSAPQPKSCNALVQETAGAAKADGYELVQAQQEATGELAVFVSGSSARLYYLTPAAGAADYMTANGWSRVDECRGPNDKTIQLLRRDITLPGRPTTPA